MNRRKNRLNVSKTTNMIDFICFDSGELTQEFIVNEVICSIFILVSEYEWMT